MSDSILEKAFEHLNGCIDSSSWSEDPQGSVSARARRLEGYSWSDLRRFEDRYETGLPKEYARFLISVGAAEFSFEKNGRRSEIVFLRLFDIASVFQDFFPPNGSLIKWILPVGMDEATQDFFFFDLRRSGPRNFGVIWHEYVPEDWAHTLDELDGWMAFEEWILKFVADLGVEA